MRRWIIGALVGLVVLAVGGPFVYIHFVAGKAPARLTLSSVPTTPANSNPGQSVPTVSASLDGTWEVASGSQAGYRVQEVLFGQSHTAVGRTTKVTGNMTLAGTSVTKAAFTVDLTAVTSDESRRDRQFQGRIMNTSTYPTATFTLTKPISLGTVPAVGIRVTVPVTGQLTMHGTTRSVSFSLQAQRTATSIQVSGSIPVTFGDYNIANPSFDFVTTGDTGQIEFLLTLAHG